MPPSLLLRVLDEIYGAIERLGVSPVVAGGLAVSYWGHPRSTQDIDLAILVSSITEISAGLRAAGLKPSKDGRVTDLGFVQVAQWLFDVEDQYMECEVDLLLSRSNYHREALHRAVACQISGVVTPLRVLTCEDLLLFKAASGRLIDLADIATLHQLHRQTLDTSYLARKAAELHLPTEFWLKP